MLDDNTISYIDNAIRLITATVILVSTFRDKKDTKKVLVLRILTPTIVVVVDVAKVTNDANTDNVTNKLYSKRD